MRVQELSATDRLEVKSWSYSQELDTYSREEIAPDNSAFFAIYDGDIFMGFGVTGLDAIVQGMELNSTDLDVGWGMAPHLIGHGRGTEFGQAVLVQAAKLATTKGFSHLRCAIYSWNTVSQLMATRAGFERSNEIVNGSGEFIIMRKEIG
jgi:RimJ/RimL family protein N-acetyltransferase